MKGINSVLGAAATYVAGAAQAVSTLLYAFLLTAPPRARLN
jgi:Zn-dependent membrane protease YugP